MKEYAYMNIFDTLSRGKGCINEENVSSFLGYLLNPNDDHDLGIEFFERFLKKIGIKETEIKTTDIDNLEIHYEFKVGLPNKNDRCRYIDVVFETSDHIIAIENKISEKSKQKNQLQEEYDGLKKSKDIDTRKSILLCYLVPKETKEGNIKTDEKDNSKTLLWDDVIKILTDILNAENSAEINPINDYTKYTIKAFINFMKNTSKPKNFTLNGENYKIYKYSSGVVYIQKDMGDCWDFVSAKIVIREKLAELDPEKYSIDETLKPKYNTQSLGAKLFKILN